MLKFEKRKNIKSMTQESQEPQPTDTPYVKLTQQRSWK